MTELVTNNNSIRKILMIGADTLIVIFSIWAALILKYDDELSSLQEYPFRYTWLPLVLLAVPIFWYSGFYKQLWRFASIMQYLILAVGTLIHTLALAGLMLVFKYNFHYSVYIIYWMLSFILITGLRVIYRLVINNTTLSQFRPLTEILPFLPRHSDENLIRVMVIGAGYAGSQIIREMIELHTGHRPVVAIDDNPIKHTYQIHGIPVVGDRAMIPRIAVEYQIQEIIVAIPSASRQNIREIVEICSRTGCKLKILPLLHELIDGKVSIADVKEVEIEDLLGRQEILLNNEEIAGSLKNEVVLVTGGGGSIGSELCRQIARYQPKQLIIFDIYENNAYQLQYELKAKYQDNLDLVVLIGSVRDELRLKTVFDRYRPNVVFHAAAHKHVPLMEDSPGEAVKNNIIGTYNTALTAARYGVKRFVLISTDKAVNPTNVMGATKRIAEMTIQSLSRQYAKTKFTAVRFGNVLGSNGSVIPLFKQQIRNDRRITVTHPEITRYFMTIPEAARLVIQAGALAKGGEIFVLDMGEPVKIIDLANDLIRLSGLEPGIDVEIAFTGLRPGEKMYEELFMDKESMDHTRHDKIFVMKPVKDVEALKEEIEGLKEVIRWSNDEFNELLGQVIL